jgi:hypothetical protein
MGNCPLASSAQTCILQLFQAYHSESVCGQVYRYSPNLSITKVTKAHIFSHKRITTTRWSVTSHLKSVNACLWDTLHSLSSVSTMLGPEWFIKPYTKAYNTPSNRNFYFQVRQSLSEYLNMITSSPLFQESTHPGVAPALCSTLGTTPYFSVSLSLLVSRVQVALHTHHSHFIGYTPVHSYLAIILALGLFWTGLISWPTHLLLRCLRSSPYGGLKWGSYRGPHTFSKVSSPVVMGRSDLGLISRPSHLL